jgi:cytochrome c biogenesis protein CcdA
LIAFNPISHNFLTGEKAMGFLLNILESLSGLLLLLVPFVIVDMINPVLLGGTIYSLGSRRPILNACGLILSFFITYLLAGLAIAATLESIMDLFHIPAKMDYVLELIIAAALLYFAAKQYKEGNQHLERKLTMDKGMTLAGAVGMGVQINIVGLPFAVPYLAAIDQVLKADLSSAGIVFVLFLYNLFYVLPFAALILLRLFYKTESDNIFECINSWMQRVCVKYMPLIFAILAILLFEDAISWLVGYREYSFLSLLI